MLRKAWRPVFDQATERHLKVTWQVTEPATDLVLPVALIEIVLRNLFDNAVSYSPEGGRILITAAETRGMVDITVANTDPGLALEDLESTFAPFWRGNPNASGHRGNAGIGLALVRRIMETMQGRVTAALEGGMVVYALHFPAPPPSTALAPHPGEVLVVPAAKV